MHAFPVLIIYNSHFADQSEHPLLSIAPAQGTCRVMCLHPHSDLTLPLMNETEILVVIETWREQLEELGKKYKWVQIFENKGTVVGCSNCLLYTSPSPRDATLSRMPSSA